MNIRKHLNKFIFAAFITLAAASLSFAQNAKTPNPRQEKLLNNLKLLMWQDAGGDKVSVKLRVHSGAAFDTLGKEGTMALLADALFPGDSAKEFFAEELGGSVEVTSNYDYIQINATGSADRILTILETIAAAVIRPVLDKETTAKIKSARLEKVKELEKNPAYVADLAVAKRLFGDYPYGRSAEGTPESLAKIDFADLLLAKQRFLTADNVTLAVSGNIKYDYVFKVVRQLFGGWEKADKKVPATFAQPNAPRNGMPVLNSPLEKTSEFRFALRGLSRNDKDFYASQILKHILQNRLQTREGKTAFVRQESRVLPGYFLFGVSQWNVEGIKRDGDKIALPVTDGYQNNFLKEPIKQPEFEKAKTAFAAESNRNDVINSWLDADTFKLSSVKDDLQNAQNVTIADVQRVLEKSQKEAVAYILVFTGEKQATSNQ